MKHVNKWDWGSHRCYSVPLPLVWQQKLTGMTCLYIKFCWWPEVNPPSSFCLFNLLGVRFLCRSSGFSLKWEGINWEFPAYGEKQVGDSSVDFELLHRKEELAAYLLRQEPWAQVGPQAPDSQSAIKSTSESPTEPTGICADFSPRSGADFCRHAPFRRFAVHLDCPCESPRSYAYRLSTS